MKGQKPKYVHMTPVQLQNWMASKGWLKAKAARELGIGRARMDRFLDPDPKTGQPIPRYIELACIALNYGNTPIK